MMSGKQKLKDVVPVAGTARGRRLSAGYVKARVSVPTPESKLKLTPDRKSTSSQSSTPVSVPHYLRASTGSCHDFCKYGGRRVVEEEERKGGSHSSKKKSGLKEGPKWKDIPSYDAVSKTTKPQVVQLNSKKLAVPTKKELERPAGLARQKLQRRVSLEVSCSGTKPVMLTPVKGVSSAPAKAKTGRPSIIRKENATISNRPKIQERSQQNIKRGVTDTVRNCAEVYMGSTCTMDRNDDGGGVERTLFVVEPELKIETVQVLPQKETVQADLDFYEDKTIEELQPVQVLPQKETVQADLDFYEEKTTEEHQPVQVLPQKETVQADLDFYEERTIEELQPVQVFPQKETVQADLDFYEEKTIEEHQPVQVLPKKETVQADLDFYEEKTIEELQPGIKKITEIDFEIEGPRGPETFEDNVIGKAPMEFLSIETDKCIQVISTQISPDKETAVESETELGEKSKSSAPDKGTTVDSEHEESNNSEPEDEAIIRFVSISGKSGVKSEADSELDFESSAEEEQSMESESDYESETGTLSISRSASSSPVRSASRNEKPEVGNSTRRRTSSNQPEEKPYKLKFKPGRVIDLKPDSDHGPRRLKFRKPRVTGLEGGNSKSSSGARKVSYSKGSESVLTGSSSADQKSAGMVLRHQDGKERKEGQNSLFNNVIEETASKLVESRKSKVKALVGAFETVISLQDGKPTSST